MRCFIPLFLTALLPLAAAELGTLVFSDDFSRNESQETSDEPGNDWGTNSKSRAKGNKQVDLVDGTMRIYIHKEADHAVSVTHDFAFVDGAVTMRFKLENEQDSLGLDFADLQYKEVHAGHLFKATFSAKNVVLSDLATGTMFLPLYDARKAGKSSDADKALIKTKQKSFSSPITVGEWHTLTVIVEGKTMSASVDDKPIGSFTSDGIAHPTKRTLRLSVPKQVVIDDVKLYKKS
jgi:hypothetical protein